MSEAAAGEGGEAAGWRLDPALPLGEAVYRALRDALHDGRLKPGDRLREEEIARRLSVSRTPVRESFNRLLAKRFVEPAGGRGLLVRRLDAAEVMELYVMREILEGAAARLASRQASEMEIETLRDLEALFEEAATEDARARANHALHDAIARVARNRYLDASLEELKDALPLLGRTTFSVPTRPDAAAAEHRLVVEAIARRDADAAEVAARAHIRGALRARLVVMREG
ncbi:GntR family transcriptional regulator [Aureimonas jatrophae]|jgi:DNA-binding GntR family transcriptional regulator|uniref:DNA-binding transcriptional regulator, GntR family n=1 Tax=Aureimonas jatrophae TaxID=1166073 RepID=A0A1H0EPJ3_9HYPH|nr:GntR family transcriptional regulator [Aureimonas jatrophae]MBB3950382.1 DNA-binding GntR family transcriptional regulator [Aureimonas jatrophae]SDN84377.1 DNA-binding transcriptional regulator, GntR family [Aureimonas jatrophae]